MKQRIQRLLFALGLISPMLLAVPVRAATTTVYGDALPGTGWSIYEGGAGKVNFVNDSTVPANGPGVVKFTTTDSNSDIAELDYVATAESTVNVNDLTDLSYWSRTEAGPAFAAPSMYIQVDEDGDTAATTTDQTYLIYEPYYQEGFGSVDTLSWHQWDVDAGIFWATANLGYTGPYNLTSGGPPEYTLDEIKTESAGGTVIGWGTYIGSFNPGYTVYVDSVNVNGNVTNFEVTSMDEDEMPTSKADCKKNGWKSYGDFKNQGDCVSFVATGGRNAPAMQNTSALRF